MAEAAASPHIVLKEKIRKLRSEVDAVLGSRSTWLRSGASRDNPVQQTSSVIQADIPIPQNAGNNGTESQNVEVFTDAVIDRNPNTTERNDPAEEEEEEDDEEEDNEMADLFVKSFRIARAAAIKEKEGAVRTNKQQKQQQQHQQQHLAVVPSKEMEEIMMWVPETGLPKLSQAETLQMRDVSKRALPLHTQLEDGLLVPSKTRRQLSKIAKKNAAKTTGAKWYNMPAQTLTPELKKDLELIKMRGAIDPKHHFKTDDSKRIPRYFQVGTVVEGPTEFYSSRLTKKQRKQTIADELLSDNLATYRKRKYLQIQEKHQSGGKKFVKKKENKRRKGK